MATNHKAPGAHAVLSPSSAERWLNCTPSARLEESFADKKSEYASEGTLAHKLGELLISEKFTGKKYPEFWKEIQASEYYSENMLQYCDDYATFVLEQLSAAQARTKDAAFYLERKLDLTEYIPEGYGTGDAVIIADSVMDLTDLKYGKGVPVSCTNNRQMMLYALGALKEFEALYDIQTVRLTIYQPRIDNISSWEISVEDLLEWGEFELKPLAEMAFKGEGPFRAGKHCQFCKAKPTCKAAADFNLQLAEYDFKPQTLLTEDEIADILNKAAMFTNWIESVQEYALDQAVNNGKKWPGYKVVEGRSNRKYVDETLVANRLLKAGFAEEIIYTKKVSGITALEKEIGKKDFASLLEGLLIKAPGKPCLVQLADKRPEYNSTEAAQTDFATA